MSRAWGPGFASSLAAEGQAQCRIEGEREVQVKLGLRVTVNFGDAGIDRFVYWIQLITNRE